MGYVRLNSIDKIKKRLGLEINGRVQKFFTNTCAIHMDKYVPFDTGTLAETVIVNGTPVPSNVKDTTITYEQPYAQYVYNGISKTGKPLNYSHDKHPAAGDHWDRRMVSAEMDKVVKEVQDYVNRGGK